MTSFWRRQAALLVQAWDEAWGDETIAPAFEYVEALAGAMIDGGSSPGAADRFFDALAALTTLVWRSSPTLRHAYGRFLPREILNQVTYRALVEHGVAPEAAFRAVRYLWASRLERFLPDNPLTLADEQNLQGFHAAQQRHFMEFGEYLRSLRPEGRRGRPRGRSPSKKLSPGIAPEEAERAAALDAAGKSWREIAAALGIGYDPYDARSVERARGRVRARIQRGRLARNPGSTK